MTGAGAGLENDVISRGDVSVFIYGLLVMHVVR